MSSKLALIIINNNNNNNSNNNVFAWFLLIDMSIHTERNTSLKIMEKLTKYKDLEIEIEKTWGMKTTTAQ